MSKAKALITVMSEAQGVRWVKGSDLGPEAKRDALSKFVHRYTGDNHPNWAKKEWKDGKPYPLQFLNDQDWLANTEFAVKKDGNLHRGVTYCHSTPTWPNNPELRKAPAKSADPAVADKD